MAAPWLVWANALQIQEIFGANVPETAIIEIMDIVIDPLGPSVRLRFNIEEYPHTAPARWVSGAFNTIQITAQFRNVADLHMHCEGCQNTAMLQVSDDGQNIRIIGKDTETAFSAKYCRVDLQAYCDSRRKAPQNGA